MWAAPAWISVYNLCFCLSKTSSTLCNITVGLKIFGTATDQCKVDHNCELEGSVTYFLKLFFVCLFFKSEINCCIHLYSVFYFEIPKNTKLKVSTSQKHICYCWSSWWYCCLAARQSRVQMQAWGVSVWGLRVLLMHAYKLILFSEKFDIFSQLWTYYFLLICLP